MTTRKKLEVLAHNMWWSWNPEALALFRQLNPNVFEASDNNPVAALQSADPSVLNDSEFVKNVDSVYDAFETYMRSDPQYGDGPQTSYFCMEYGIHESLPTYAGGLGILAGDHTKQASDFGLPFTAVGLFLKNGYFRQHFDSSGWQLESYPTFDAASHPVELLTDTTGQPLTVDVHVGRELLHLRAWQISLGRTKLYLLDSDFEENPAHLRDLTCKLYQGDRTTRIRQEIILGIGGIRLIRALGIETDVYHMNEGHCAFLTLELLRECIESGMSREQAEQWVRDHSVFTTHTPVMAGHDRFSPDLVLDQLAVLREQLGMSDHDFMSYGRVQPNDPSEAFTMTVLGLKLSRHANGVSRLNGEVARKQWQDLFPDRPVEQIPIGHITNGVHLPTWSAPQSRLFIKKHIGQWEHYRNDPDLWQHVNEVSDRDLWEYRNMLRRTLVEFVDRYARKQTLHQEPNLDPNVLTIGFARRFATYKRAPLLFYDLDRAIHLFSQSDQPIQVIYAGKAHPADEGGKRFIQQIFELSQHPALKGRLIFLENYNMEVGRMLVSGCDVWLNNPRRPMEASGTSGQKIAVHGGLNVSILDGWWPEGYNGNNGWAIGHDASAEYRDPHEQDAEDAYFLYDVLEQQVIPTFYRRNEQGIPVAWTARMREAMQTLTYPFSAARMLSDYIEQMYTNSVSESIVGQ